MNIWEDNIKTGNKGMKWIPAAQDKDSQWDSVKAIMNLREE